MEELLEVKDLSLHVGNFKLGPIQLKIKKGEIFSILGKTGSGKTLILESIAGYYPETEKSIVLFGHHQDEIPLERRKIGFVYQDYGLFPHMNVYENISYGPKMNKWSKKIIKQKVERLLEEFEISRIAKQYPGTLSGGEKQRTALARALIMNPDVLLLDEPFSALDPITKQKMYDKIKEIHQNFECTIIFVTHNFEEAQQLADRVGIMINGELKIVTKASLLLENQKDKEVQKFLGLIKIK